MALAELAAADGEQVAWRGGKRHVARLREERLNANPAKIDADGWMLITGGLGGLGQRVAQWLFCRGRGTSRSWVAAGPTSRRWRPSRPCAKAALR
ncbi:MAG: KR domain-containing protein [Deltaproteobacteria bacterium]|nr:KR domain-containing protein [Deltaproteobacteria bacterium]